jgi:hypothetical protein
MTPGDPKEKPVNWARLRQRYTSLMFRREPVLDGLVFSGIVVEARDPEELVIETERLLVERAVNEPQGTT